MTDISLDDFNQPTAQPQTSSNDIDGNDLINFISKSKISGTPESSIAQQATGKSGQSTFPLDAPNTVYGSVLPMSSNEVTGETSFAAPEMIRSPARGILSLMGRAGGMQEGATEQNPNPEQALNSDEMNALMLSSPTSVASGAANLPRTAAGALDAGIGAGRLAANTITSPIDTLSKTGIFGSIDQGAADVATLAKNKYGIDLHAPQISNSPFMKYMDSATGKIPLSGGAAKAETQYGQLEKAIAGTFGAQDLSQESMSAARQTLRNNYNSIADKTGVVGDDKLVNDLANIQHEASQTDVGGKMDNILDNVLGRFQNNQLTAQDYKSLTAKGTPLDRLQQAADPNVRFYAGKIGDALDDALSRSASPQDQATLKSTDMQWKNMKTVENIAAKMSPDGQIPLSQLRTSVIKSFKDYPYTGGGDLGELAKISQYMKEPPSSGTAERGLAYASMIFPAEKLMTGDLHGAVADVAGAAGIMGAAKGAQSILNSEGYKNMLLRNLREGNNLGRYFPDNIPSPAASVATPAASAVMNPDNNSGSGNRLSSYSQ